MLVACAIGAAFFIYGALGGLAFTNAIWRRRLMPFFCFSFGLLFGWLLFW